MYILTQASNIIFYWEGEFGIRSSHQTLDQSTNILNRLAACIGLGCDAPEP